MFQRERSPSPDEIAELRTELARSQAELAQVTTEASRISDELASSRAWLTALSERVERTGGLTEYLGEELDRLRRLVPDAIALGQEALGLETFTTPTGDQVLGFRHDGDSRLDVYVGFEDVFRGSEAEIATRQRPYLTLLGDHAPVLDVGCGRGELLGVLQEAGVKASGVDFDPEMVARCRAKHLDVEVGDAVAALESAVPQSVGSVVAAQVIEHLPYPQLLAFFTGLRRALQPGGIAILETVNPHNPQALKHFWIDPSHQHPLFPEVVLSLLRLNGFAEGYIWYPGGSGDLDRDRCGQFDYVIVGTTSR